jgi:hypothetical protein
MKKLIKKKYKKIYIVKLYDFKKSHLKKKIKFTLFLGFENKDNKNFLDIIRSHPNTLNKNKNDFLRIDKDFNFLFSIEKINPSILNIKKVNFL